MLVLIATISSESWTTSLLFLNSRGNNYQNKYNRIEPGVRTLLYFRIYRTRFLKALSMLTTYFADVSMNLHPRCFARISTLCHDGVVSTRPGGWTCKRSGHTMYTNHSLMFEVALVCEDYKGKESLPLMWTTHWWKVPISSMD